MEITKYKRQHIEECAVEANKPLANTPPALLQNVPSKFASRIGFKVTHGLPEGEGVFEKTHRT